MQRIPKPWPSAEDLTALLDKADVMPILELGGNDVEHCILESLLEPLPSRRIQWLTLFRQVLTLFCTLSQSCESQWCCVVWEWGLIQTWGPVYCCRFLCSWIVHECVFEFCVCMVFLTHFRGWMWNRCTSHRCPTSVSLRWFWFFVKDLWINIILCFFAWILGIIHAWSVYASFISQWIQTCSIGGLSHETQEFICRA